MNVSCMPLLGYNIGAPLGEWLLEEDEKIWKKD